MDDKCIDINYYLVSRAARQFRRLGEFCWFVWGFMQITLLKNPSSDTSMQYSCTSLVWICTIILELYYLSCVKEKGKYTQFTSFIQLLLLFWAAIKHTTLLFTATGCVPPPVDGRKVTFICLVQVRLRTEYHLFQVQPSQVQPSPWTHDLQIMTVHFMSLRRLL